MRALRHRRQISMMFPAPDHRDFLVGNLATPPLNRPSRRTASKSEPECFAPSPPLRPISRRTAAAPWALFTPKSGSGLGSAIPVAAATKKRRSAPAVRPVVKRRPGRSPESSRPLLLLNVLAHDLNWGFANRTGKVRPRP